jgi:tRNA U38,U39,U40 pseudouridine synthase TruA
MEGHCKAVPGLSPHLTGLLPLPFPCPSLQVRVFGVQRATEGFDARKCCDRLKYEYILPAWAFEPQAAATC